MSARKFGFVTSGHHVRNGITRFASSVQRLPYVFLSYIAASLDISRIVHDNGSVLARGNVDNDRVVLKNPADDTVDFKVSAHGRPPCSGDASSIAHVRSTILVFLQITSYWFSSPEPAMT
jgi:hypothetical protein